MESEKSVDKDSWPCDECGSILKTRIMLRHHWKGVWGKTVDKNKEPEKVKTKIVLPQQPEVAIEYNCENCEKKFSNWNDYY